MTNTQTSPVLDEPTRKYVQCVLASGLAEIADIKKIVASLLVDSDQFTPERISNGLVGGGILTPWQAKKVLAGRNRGFFLGSYRLLRPLGKGGMGVVYLGEHEVMKRQMALKILPPEATENPRRIAQFKQEARAAAQLDHENIVRAYDFAVTDGKLYLVMEYVDGIDLHQAVVRDGTMTVPAAMDILAQSASGLAHAHDRGVVHRDIKPGNLMLRTDGVVKISDMGLARFGWTNSNEESDKRFMGTADFVAPEQVLNSQSADARSDIYSLGCTVFYLLTGQTAFVGETVNHRLAQHQTAAVPDVRTYCACPPAVANLLCRMMSKRPEDRPNSASELLNWASRLGHGESQRLSGVMPISDTTINQASYLETQNDTSLSGDIEVVTEAAEVMFDDLPAIDFDGIEAPAEHVAGTHTPDLDVGCVQSLDSRGLPSSSELNRAGVAVPNSEHSGSQLPNKQLRKKTQAANPTDNRKMLVGVGLTLAVLGIATTLAFVLFSLMGDEELPKIKRTINDKGERVFVIRE